MEEDGAEPGGFFLGAAALFGLVDAGCRHDGRHDRLAGVLRAQDGAAEIAGQSRAEDRAGVIAWQAGQAVLRQGDQTRRYDSLDALVQDAVGTPLPVRALFGWLHGDAQAVPGWQPDLSRLGDGRLSARRSMPLPTAELRLVLDR